MLFNNILKNGDNMVRDYKIQNRIKNILNYKNDIIVVDSVESTNTALKQMAADGADEGTVLIAKSQTKGRGRLGRSFVSDDGGLYLSLLLRPKSSAEASLLITVAAAVSVAVAIENICQKNCQIKWVNDIYLNGKKVSGILTEGAINPQNGRLDYAVPPLMALPEIRKAVGPEMVIFVDCAIETGLDVFKVLALGADACSIGRPLMGSLKNGGAEEVAAHMQRIQADLAYAMAMTCCHDLSEIQPDILHKRSF